MNLKRKNLVYSFEKEEVATAEEEVPVDKAWPLQELEHRRWSAEEEPSTGAFGPAEAASCEVEPEAVPEPEMIDQASTGNPCKGQTRCCCCCCCSATNERCLSPEFVAHCEHTQICSSLITSTFTRLSFSSSLCKVKSDSVHCFAKKGSVTVFPYKAVET